MNITKSNRLFHPYLLKLHTIGDDSSWTYTQSSPATNFSKVIDTIKNITIMFIPTHQPIDLTFQHVFYATSDQRK